MIKKDVINGGVMPSCFLVCNAGSSSIKFSLFHNETLEVLFHGLAENVLTAPVLSIYGSDDAEVFKGAVSEPGYTVVMKTILVWVEDKAEGADIIAIGHRVVHGGQAFSHPVQITDDILVSLKAFIPLAPLHQPYNVQVIEACASLYPGIPQIACFDTAFHRSQPPISQRSALPKHYEDDGVVRYGFHGLSYEYITSVLPDYAGKQAKGRVVIAHLGNGASMCGMVDGKSQVTTMGFTALDGLMMGTRCGAIDPGILLYLLQEKHMSVDALSDLLYQESGLKGVSGISHDVRVLLADGSLDARRAIDLFCYKAARHLASLLPVIGGLDVLVFTAGIGEHAPAIRSGICQHLSWLGVKLEGDDNAKLRPKISSDSSAVDVYVIPTDEERVIAQAMQRMCRMAK
jgi:acetate kinase